MGNQRKTGAVLSYIQIALHSIIQIVYTPFLIRMLGQAEYGLYSLVASIIGYLTVLDLGFGNALIVYTSKFHAKKEYDKERKLHGMFFVVYVVIGIIALIASITLSLLSDNIFHNSMTVDEINELRIMILILGFNLFITFVFSVYNAIISAYEKFVFQKALSIINTIAQPIIMMPLLFMGYKSVALTIVITIINLFVLVSTYLYCRRNIKIRVKFTGFDKVIFKTIVGYSFWIFLAIVVDKVNWSADQTILGVVSGTMAISVYAAASQLNQMFITLSTSISSILLPKVSKMVAENADNKKLTDEFVKVGRMQYYIIFLAASGLVLFGKQFIKLWLGDGFDETYGIALILILPLCVPLIQNLGLSIMQARNKYYFRAIIMSVMAIFNIIISIFLAQKFGATGAAIGTAISLIICNIILINIYYHKVMHLDMILFWKNIGIMTVKFIPSVLFAVVLLMFTTLDGWSGFAVYALSYTTVYGITAYLLCANDYEKSILNKIKGKLIHREWLN